MNNDLRAPVRGVVVDAGHPSEIKPSIKRISCSKL